MADWTLLHHYRLAARYNTGANRILYAACGRLPEPEPTACRPAFFASIHGTLNHIMVGDRTWLARVRGDVVPSTGLDAIPYADFAALRAPREELDAEIEGFAADLASGFLAGSIAYVNNADAACDDPVPLLLAHFFNHQTHHRGQVHDMLSQTAVAPPSLDLHRVINPAQP